MNNTGLKFGGRVKGTQNKVSTSTKIWLKTVFENNQKQFEKDLKVLKPYERVQVFAGMLKYMVPTLQSVDTNVEFSKLSDFEISQIVDSLLMSIEKE